MRLELHPEARTELRRAALWYDEGRSGSGDELVAEVSAARAPFRPWGCRLRPQWRSDPTPRMPHGKHSHLVTAGNVVDVIARLLQQNAPSAPDGRLPIETPDLWSDANNLERSGEFLEEEVWRRVPVVAPPIVNCADLDVGLRCGSNREAHRRWRSSSTIADAGRSRPASADSQDKERASCKARRSTSVRSSLSSSATRSMVVPSGRVVGSSRTSRPFSTRARRGLIRLLYGFH